MLTAPVTYQNWLAETKVDGIFSEKTRSTLLVAIDNALRTYELAMPADKIDTLHALWDAYDAWYASKSKTSGGALKSIRNSGDQMDVFETWLKAEEARLLPAAEGGWGNPNCYSYAMKCKNPVGNAMTPGMAAGAVAAPDTDKVDLIAYGHRLFAGIEADAAADGGKQVTFYPVGVETSRVRPHPGTMPQVQHGEYLVAMLVTARGFHFMRRDTATGLWSHKNRSDGEVEVTVTRSTAAGRLPKRNVPITDAVAVEMLSNPFPPQNYDTLGGGFTFAGYILVPTAGFTVAGSTKKFS
jgi:hypothetical protein